MITIYREKDSKLEEIDKIEKNCWVDVTNPTPEEISRLLTDYDIPRDFLMDPLDVDERSRFEREGDKILMIVRVPALSESGGPAKYVTIPIGIILFEDFVLTICARENDILNRFISGAVKNFSLQDKERFILRIFFRTTIHYLAYLKQVNRETNEVESDLQRSLKNEELIALLGLEKSLVYFTTSLRSNQLMYGKLVKSELFQKPENDDLLEDVMIDTKQALEMANVYSNILSGMMDAFASIISNNLNIVMKVLTSITIILMIPTLVASIYGMNVDLPLGDSPHAFVILMGVSIVLSLAGVVVFLRKKIL